MVHVIRAWIGRVLVALLAGTLAGCAFTNFRESSRFGGAREVQAIYIYSFLDLREREFGARFLEELRGQLSKALDNHEVRNAQLAYSESPLRAPRPRDTSPWLPPNDSTQVPVGRIVAANAAAEKTFGATHRLIVFPSTTTRNGAGPGGSNLFIVRWEIYDAATGRLDWSAESVTSHHNVMGNDETPVERAKAMTGTIVKELLKAGVIPRRGLI